MAVIKPRKKGLQMEDKPNPNEMINIEQLLVSNTLQLDAVTQLLIEKGIFTRQEFFDMLKRVQAEYQSEKDTPSG